MRNLLLLLLLLLFLLFLPSVALAQPRDSTATSETAFGSIASSYAEKLADATYFQFEVVNEADCDVEVRLDDTDNAAEIPVPAGTSFEEDFGGPSFYASTSISLQYMSGETCSSGQVYIRGIVND